MRWLPWILVILLAIALLCRCQKQKTTTQIVFDTITVFDTVTYDSAVPKDSIVIRYEIQRLPVVNDSTPQQKDSIVHHLPEQDSTDVVIPITQKHYKEDDYELWISGYRAALDSIRLFRKESMLKPVVPLKRNKRWGFGLQAGYGVPGGWYVGGGVSYNLVIW